MSITSRILLPAAGISLFLSGCLPGPWEYKPESDPGFRGLTLTAYAVAGQPAGDVCVERLLSLTEASTDAFPFYDSAAVGITGIFSDGGQTLSLQPRPRPANCFEGDTAARFMAGESYTLNARIVWDSAGSSTVTELTAVAHVPADFSIADSAVAPSLASVGANLDSIFKPSVFMQLPPGPRQLFLEEFGDTLSAMDGDSAALDAWLDENGERMNTRVREWLQGDLLHYGRDDSLFYIGGRFATLSHFFRSTRSDGVRGVLITQRHDTTESRPLNPFDELFGFTPDTADFYSPGDIRRLFFFPDAPKPAGGSILDSIGMSNSVFRTGPNRLYFYGVERIYADYLLAIQEAGGNPKIRVPSNVSGGKGFFAGMGVDSFDIHIRLDSATRAVPFPVSRAAHCRENGWFDSRDCLGYYREYCTATGWDRSDCRLDAIYTCLDPAEGPAAPPGLCDSASVWAAADPLLKEESERRWCIDNDYPAGVEECAPVRAECETGPDGNDCRRILWKRCELGYWDSTALPACAEGLKSFCRADGDTHRILCRNAGT